MKLHIHSWLVVTRPNPNPHPKPLGIPLVPVALSLSLAASPRLAPITTRAPRTHSPRGAARRRLTRRWWWWCGGRSGTWRGSSGGRWATCRSRPSTAGRGRRMWGRRRERGRGRGRGRRGGWRWRRSAGSTDAGSPSPSSRPTTTRPRCTSTRPGSTSASSGTRRPWWCTATTPRSPSRSTSCSSTAAPSPAAPPGRSSSATSPSVAMSPPPRGYTRLSHHSPHRCYAAALPIDFVPHLNFDLIDVILTLFFSLFVFTTRKIAMRVHAGWINFGCLAMLFLFGTMGMSIKAQIYPLVITKADSVWLAMLASYVF